MEARANKPVKRFDIQPRANWRETVEQEGLIWHSTQDGPYWNEAAYYRFTLVQVEEIEAATAELYRLFLEAGQAVLDRNLLGRFGIPEWCWPLIARAWEEEPPALNHGRFDLGYDGKGPPKLFEFNCDTPTSLVEAAVIQWNWKEAVFPRADQFNSLHERLVAKWRNIGPLLPPLTHFAHVNDDAGEDTMTVTYLRETARQAGVETAPIIIDDIGWNGSRFVDLDERNIDALFHLYPWEWLVHEEFGRRIIDCYDTQLWIEPIWKMIWSNKAILPVLWELFPGHPNLLAAAYEPGRMRSYARKPILAREGANILIVQDGVEIASSGGDYGEQGYIYQELFKLPDFDGHHPVIGSWVVDGDPAGMGIREAGLITDNTARFVPHIIKG
jgi:glutathionylspermidine synthase